jgi:hypothetical protein
MSGSTVIRFPARHAAVVWIAREADAWLVLAPRGHGWLHGCYQDALTDANWLSENLGFVVRRASTAGYQTEPPHGEHTAAVRRL